LHALFKCFPGGCGIDFTARLHVFRRIPALTAIDDQIERQTTITEEVSVSGPSLPARASLTHWSRPSDSLFDDHQVFQNLRHRPPIRTRFLVTHFPPEPVERHRDNCSFSVNQIT